MSEFVLNTPKSDDLDVPKFIESFAAVSQQRSSLYAWLAKWVAVERSKADLAHYAGPDAAVLWEVLSNCGLKEEVRRFKQALVLLADLPYSDLELAADFAAAFLLAAEACATPYASWYIEADKRMYGQPAVHMQSFLSQNGLQLDSHFREPADHLAVFLACLSHWIEQAADAPVESIEEVALLQADFIQTALLSWVPLWADRCQKLQLKTDVYPAFASLLSAFLLADTDYLSDS